MKLKQHTIRKFFAVLLIVVFSLKAGTGLYLHDYIHVKNISCTTHGNAAEIGLACNCIIDFYLPFTETEQQKIVAPFVVYREINQSYSSSLFTSPIFFYSLRGPPAVS